MTKRATDRWGEVGLNLAINIAVPAFVLLRLSGEERLGPVWALIVALAFPIGFGLYDLLWRRQYNFYSIIGLVGVGLTGGIGLLELDPRWLAVKEASVPLVIGVAILVSRTTRYPLVATLLEKVINRERVQRALRERGALGAYQRRMVGVTYMIAGSFFLSATLNFLLTRLIVVSRPGTAAFNEELGTLTALSYPVIALPALLILWLAVIWLVSGIQKQTDLDLKNIFNS